ncbi:uncharacterized protein F5891DRAFT_980143 [Suillus fuscotomentosus]|uniref:Uncharacterized protein n=1 Tax=Suillus fuscotomentosus TaxID=1912939 RepID=A0AAD4E6C2_9AGAM|nr:uncharacterized protein F5891DRAFT_980143 [Suillus fuscotomentosus]KAG1900548.1 hypothetical protein F5891DRAFT_980143 [Suillus fuscotomentosus]
MDNNDIRSDGPPRSKTPRESTGPWFTVQWYNDHELTDMEKKSIAATGADSPLGSDKGANLCLRNKYKKVKASFGSTGAGVMPNEGSQAKNLLDTALLELPWYKDLDTIWHSNPLMAMTTHSSKPGIDHATPLSSPPIPPTFSHRIPPTFSQHSAITSPQHSANVQPSHPPNVQPLYSPNIQPLHPPNLSYPVPLHHAPPVPPNANILAGGQYPPAVLQQPPPAPSYLPPEVHLPGLLSDDDDAKNNFSFDRRLGDPAKDDDMILNDASPVVGKKHQLPSMPSPPPNVPELFKGAEALKLWEPTQTAVRDVVQRVDTTIDDVQHYFVRQQLEEEEDEVRRVAAGGTSERQD